MKLTNCITHPWNLITDLIKGALIGYSVVVFAEILTLVLPKFLAYVIAGTVGMFVLLLATGNIKLERSLREEFREATPDEVDKEADDIARQNPEAPTVAILRQLAVDMRQKAAANWSAR